jgi:hypothetical protein
MKERAARGGGGLGLQALLPDLGMKAAAELAKRARSARVLKVFIVLGDVS